MTLQYPGECCPFLINFSYICGVERLSRLTLHICESVFRKSLSENVEVFIIRRAIRNNTHFRIDTCGRAHSACPDIPYLSECGVSCRLFLIGSFHNLLIDKRKSAPHFLCICESSWGWIYICCDYESEVTGFLRGYY